MVICTVHQESGENVSPPTGIFQTNLLHLRWPVSVWISNRHVYQKVPFILFSSLQLEDYVWFEMLLRKDRWDFGPLGLGQKRIAAEFGPSLWPSGIMKTEQVQAQETAPFLSYKSFYLHWKLRAQTQPMCEQNHSGC